MRRVRILLLTILTMAVLVPWVGCANPAADAPEAKVEEAAAPPPADPGQNIAGRKYLIDGSQSKVSFVGSKVTGSHDGGFESFKGQIVVLDGNPEKATVSVEIDTTSLWSDNDDLTGHLKSDDFFAVETYPTSTFTSTAISAGEDGTYEITGTLELHGVTKQITFPATITVADDHVVAQAEFSIKRFDFEIVYPGRADDLIRDEVLIKLDLNASAGA